MISLVLETLMLENINMERLRAMVNIHGATETFTWDNFLMV